MTTLVGASFTWNTSVSSLVEQLSTKRVWKACASTVAASPLKARKCCIARSASSTGMKSMRLAPARLCKSCRNALDINSIRLHAYYINMLLDGYKWCHALFWLGCSPYTQSIIKLRTFIIAAVVVANQAGSTYLQQVHVAEKGQSRGKRSPHPSNFNQQSINEYNVSDLLCASK